ncbi:response regulator [Alsobacter soli]|uniref:Response regulator n=1 Tax=Alsobacter soli TaxID=2109933 RepID=A0A2T1HW65_9HYPH|nr:response regulator [Alsobacter soli]PSC05906.1 response regulator [Alsobacter soli]
MIAIHRSAEGLRAAPRPFVETPRVLLVEDSGLLRWHAADMLADAGYAVTEAEDAASAFRLLVRHRFDLLVTDIDLGPGPDGFELSRYAVLAYPGLPVIYASGRASLDPAERAPGSAFVPKPYAPQELIAAARKALDKSRETVSRRFI